MPEKKIPTRMCAGCFARKAKKEFIRIVRGPGGDISIDHTGKQDGRGVYLCPDAVCLKKAQKSRRIARNLNCVIPDEVYDILAAEVTADG
jgi:predicted RNA-binding protein YlxR (DUF448 family)